MALQHVYHRPFDPSGEDSLARIARRVRRGSKVLDLGAGPGVLGRHLNDALGCRVDGVEMSPRAAELARPYYDRLVVADLDAATLEDLGLEGGYDFVICADVLEHLREPARLLAQLPSVLAPGGRMLASVPNLAYAGLLGELLGDRFEYRDEGLLDRTHLRFFTRSSLLTMLRDLAWVPTAVEAVTVPLSRSEFASCDLSAMAPQVRDWLLHRPDALSYQFVVEAGRSPDCVPGSMLEHDAQRAPEFVFRCQLFWRQATTSYSEAASSVVFARLGGERQTVRFRLPAEPGLAALRLDPADRPGFIHLFRLTLRSLEGAVLWAWSPEHPLPAAGWQQLAPVGLPESGAASLLLHASGSDPAFNLALPDAVVEALSHGADFELEASWPMSSEARALAREYVPRSELDELERVVCTLREELARMAGERSEPPAERARWWRSVWRAWRGR